MHIRPATIHDHEAVWTMLEPTIRSGEVFALRSDLDKASALAFWFTAPHTVFLTEDGNGAPLGSYYIQPNHPGPASHVANCGYLTHPSARGRGVASAMCAHSLDFARQSGYRAMQFNLVVSTNQPAIHLWARHGFKTIARLPGAFLHPVEGYVDALIMWQSLV